MARNFIKTAIKHPGALHRDLGVPMGQNIPPKKLRRAMHSDSKLTRERANLAVTLEHLPRR